MLADMLRVSLVLVLLPLSFSQISFPVDTPRSATSDKTANTYFGSSDQVAASLLKNGSSTGIIPIIVWGTVRPAAVKRVCNEIVNNGSKSVSLAVSGDEWGGPKSYTKEYSVVATGGCNSVPDNSGTQLVFLDDTGRKSAIVCPKNATRDGCGIFWTGSDVTSAYNKLQANGRRHHRMLAEMAITQDHGFQDSSIQESSYQHQRRLQSTCTAGVGLAGAAASGVIAASKATRGVAAVKTFLVGAAAIIGAEFCPKDSGCFPGDVTVETYSKGSQMISNLRLNDQVATYISNSALKYSPVLAFGRHDETSFAWFLDIAFMNTKTMQQGQISLTEDHFIYTASGKSKRAGKIGLGEQILIKEQQGGLVAANVTGIMPRLAQGLYKPFTSEGSMIVNGVLVSVHSGWFLDKVFDRVGLTDWLPAVYQAILKPLVVLRTILGPYLYGKLYAVIAKEFDTARSGTAHVWHTTFAASTITMLAMMLVWKIKVSPISKAM